MDIFEELKKLLNQKFDPVLLHPTYQEILRIAEHGPPKLRRQASLALELAEKCSIISVETYCGENADDTILRVAKEWRCAVATNDRELRKRLRREGVPNIFLRQRAYLAMEGSIH